MSDFYCGACGYITSSKSSMDRHRMRKTPCKPKNNPPKPAPVPTPSTLSSKEGVEQGK